MIVRARLDALTCLRLRREVEAVAERLQQALLEDTQPRFERRSVTQRCERLMIVVEQTRLRIVAGRGPQQQPVEVERPPQTGGRQRRRGLRPPPAPEVRRPPPPPP